MRDGCAGLDGTSKTAYRYGLAVNTAILIRHSHRVFAWRKSAQGLAGCPVAPEIGVGPIATGWIGRGAAVIRASGGFIGCAGI